jgi:hypothetical protein
VVVTGTNPSSMPTFIPTRNAPSWLNLRSISKV